MTSPTQKSTSRTPPAAASPAAGAKPPRKEIYIALMTGEKPVPVGILSYAEVKRADGSVETGACGFSYLPRYQGPSLDPINLNYKEAGTRHFALPTNLKSSGLFRVFADSLPGSWGRRLLANEIPGIDKLNDVQLLAKLAEEGRATGALLSFTRRPGDETPLSQLSQVEDVRVKSMKDLMNLASRLSKNELGASLVHGGARAKTTFHDIDGEVGLRGTHYIVKFNDRVDAYNSARLEHATLCLAREAGINAVRTKVIRVRQDGQIIGDMFLTERYDRSTDESGMDVRCHKVSIFALTDPDQVSAQDKGDYMHAFEALRKCSSDPKADCDLLYLRMLFNVAVNNTDDHLKNHEVLVSAGTDGASVCRLAPAYDLLPIAHPYVHTTKIAGLDSGVLSDQFISLTSKKFGIDPTAATKMRDQVVSAVSKWKAVLARAGCDDTDAAYMRKALSQSGKLAQKSMQLPSGMRNPIAELIDGVPAAPKAPAPPGIRPK